MWGSPVVVPPQGRKAVLLELHEGHPGMTRMKSLSRMYVWWPNIEIDIIASVQNCAHCQEQQSAPPVCTTPTLEVAIQTMGQSAYGFCGSFSWEDDLGSH